MYSLLRPYLAALIGIQVLNIVDSQTMIKCKGRIEFYAESFDLNKLPHRLSFYARHNTSSVERCAASCYAREFCKLALFRHTDGLCQLSYSSGNCHQKRLFPSYESVALSNDLVEPVTAIYCLECRQGINQKAEAGSGVSESPSRSNNAAPKRKAKQQPPPVATSSKTRAAITNSNCFVEVRDSVLLGASFWTERGLSLEDCKCLCARTWAYRRFSQQCKSIQYYNDQRLCTLNAEDSSNGTFPLLKLVETSFPVQYFDFPCAERESNRYFGARCQFRVPAAKPQSLAQLSPVKSDQCFSRLDGYLLDERAMVMEHALSVEDCKCLCVQYALGNDSGNAHANATCKSLMYYSAEGDCILNRESRKQRPELFRRQLSHLAVSYYDLDCSTGSQDIEDYFVSNCYSETAGVSPAARQ